jgi:hypothetical protein
MRGVHPARRPRFRFGVWMDLIDWMCKAVDVVDPYRKLRSYNFTLIESRLPYPFSDRQDLAFHYILGIDERIPLQRF